MAKRAQATNDRPRKGARSKQISNAETDALKLQLAQRNRDMAVMGFKLAALEQEWETMKSQHEALKMMHGDLDRVHQDALLIMGALGEIFGIAPLNLSLPSRLKRVIMQRIGVGVPPGEFTAKVYGTKIEIGDSDSAEQVQQKIDDIRKKQIKNWLSVQLDGFIGK
jgi:hypothetical protein